MRFTVVAVLFGVANAATTSVCSADNCLRAVRATVSLAKNVADCSSYFQTTVTPATSSFTATATVTSTATATATVFNNKRRRNNGAMVEARVPTPTATPQPVTVAPTAIPTYASACSGSVRYSSACSCVGAKATTVTVAAPSVTGTVTSTVTVTATVTTVETKPTVGFSGFDSSDCTTYPSGAGGSFIAGECVQLPTQISLLDDTFSPGTCPGATPEQCSIVFYTDLGCTSVERTVPATPGCQYVGTDFSGILQCPGCPS